MKKDDDSGSNAVLIPLDARYLEHAVCLGTTLLIGSCCRGQISEEERYSYLEILLINLFAVLVEERIADASPVYGQRHAMSSGLAIGSLLLPWVLYTQGGCHTMALSSFGVMLFLGMMLPWVSGREKQQWIPDELIFLCGLVLYAYLLFFYSDSRVYDAIISLLCIACFHGIMQYAPFTFTLGEGVALSSGTVHVVLEMWRILLGDRVAYTSPIALCIVSVVGMSLVLFLSSVLVHQLVQRRRGLSWAVHGAACIAVGIVVYHYYHEGVAWFIEHIIYDMNRRKIIIFWIATLSVSLPFMMMLGRRDMPIVLPHTMVRKGFHALALILFIPSLVLDSGLLGMALSIALAAFMALEIIRISHVPYVSRYVHSCMSAFVDSRDGGVFYVTHMTLLLGLALPIWISQPWDDPYARFASLAGIMATGVGDAMASIVGTLYGKTKIAYNCNKTLEGSIAGIVSIIFSWLVAYMFILPPGTPHGPMDVAWLMFATIASSFLESITDQFDNLFVSLHYYALLKCI
ncbi:hypothetical protein M9434_005567 [Picochlorum sp. BPE23]|nr:hypothetical protein M9434_005567 [Picochlorum sp. BPE23]